MRTLYDLLGVAPTATTEQIRVAYKRQAMKLHPDKNPDEDAKHLYQSIQRAVKILTNPTSRKEYDELGVEVIETELMNAVSATLATGLQQFVEQCISTDEDVKLSSLTEHYEKMLIDTRKEAFMLKSKLKKLNKMEKRLSIKGYDTMYAEIHTEIHNKTQTALSNKNKNIAILKKVVGILQGAVDNGIEGTALLGYMTQGKAHA